MGWTGMDPSRLIFDLEADRIASLALDDEMVESERGVVLSEYTTGMENSNYRLLERSGTSGAFSDITTASGASVSMSGDQVIFSGVDSTELGSYYTLGTVDKNNSPTAVTLRSFNASPHPRPLSQGEMGVLAAFMSTVIGIILAWWVRSKRRQTAKPNRPVTTDN